jgi:peptide/nickel transport system ATP-binding protein
MGATEKVFGSPTHSYTKMLLASVPQLHRKWQEIADDLKMSEEDLITLETASKKAFESVGEILAPDAPDSVLVEIDSNHLVRYSPEEAKKKKKKSLAGKNA